MRQLRAYEIRDDLSAKSVPSRWFVCRRLWFVSAVLCVAHMACFDMEIPDGDTGDVVLSGPETPLTDVVPPDAAESDAGSDPTPSDVGLPDGMEADSLARDTSTPAPDLAAVQEQVFQVSCAPCHTDRVSGALSLRASDQLLTNLLSASVQLPDMPRVTPGDLSQSYLWLKVTGAHVEAGGLGELMPLGATLSREQLDLLRRWIEESAANELAGSP